MVTLLIWLCIWKKKHPSLQNVCASCFFPCRRSGLLQAVQHPTAFYCRTSNANGSGAAGWTMADGWWDICLRFTTCWLRHPYRNSTWCFGKLEIQKWSTSHSCLLHHCVICGDCKEFHSLSVTNIYYIYIYVFIHTYHWSQNIPVPLTFRNSFALVMSQFQHLNKKSLQLANTIQLHVTSGCSCGTCFFSYCGSCMKLHNVKTWFVGSLQNVSLLYKL